MKQDINNKSHWIADDGKIMKNVVYNQIYGNEIVLGDDDNIENYIEIDDPEWSATEAEMGNAALLKFINSKTGEDFKSLGDAVINILNK